MRTPPLVLLVLELVRFLILPPRIVFCYDESPWQPVLYDYYHIDLSELGGGGHRGQGVSVPDYGGYRGKVPLPRDAIVDVINDLGIKLLAIHNEHNDNNIAISPYGAFSVLAALSEGLQGDSAHEILHAAHIPKDKHVIRVGLRDIHRHLKSYFIPQEGFLAGLTLNLNNVTLRSEYEDVLHFYGFDYGSFNNALYPEPPTTKKPSEATTTLETGLAVSDGTTVMSTPKMQETTTEISTRLGGPTTEKPPEDTTTESARTTTILMSTESEFKVKEEPTTATEQQSTQPATTTKTTTVAPITTTTTQALTQSTDSPTIIQTVTAKTFETTETFEEKISKKINTTIQFSTTEIMATTKEISKATTLQTTIESAATSTKLPSETTTKLPETTLTTTIATTTTEAVTTAPTTSPVTTTVATTTVPTTTKSTTTTVDSTMTSGNTVRTTREITMEPENLLTTITPPTIAPETTTLTEEATTTTILQTTTISPLEDATVTDVGVQNATETTTTNLPTTLTKEATTTILQTTTISPLEDTTEVQNELVDATTSPQFTDQTLTDLESTTTPFFFGTTPEFQDTVNLPEAQNNFDFNNNYNYDANNVPPAYDENMVNPSVMPEPPQGAGFNENFKRSARSVVDYVIARFYDDPHHYRPPLPQRPQYMSQDPLTFAIYGKFRESGINFMKYDTVLPYFFVQNLNALALSFPLDSTKYYLLLLLPLRDNGVDQLICDLRLHGNLRYIIDNLRLTHVVATIPSFMLKGYVTLTPALQTLGIRQIFEPRQADFSPMTNVTDIYVTNIEQAVTVTIRNYLDPSAQRYKNFRRFPPVHFKADHPFLYFVIDSDLHVALMVGKVINPLNSRIR